MPVQLPAQIADVDLPAQPNDPPTIADVAAAVWYHAEVTRADQGDNTPTLDELAMVEVYKAEVISTHSALGMAPAWFAPALDLVLAPIRITLAQTRNSQLLDGRITPFLIMPFNDGTMPPANLPALVNRTAVRALNAAQSTAYVNGYGLVGNLATVGARRKATGRAIRCTVPI